MKPLLKYWGVIVTLLVWVLGGSVWLLKLGWRVDVLERRSDALEIQYKNLNEDNLIRKGAAEVWKARGLVGPAPAPSR